MFSREAVTQLLKDNQNFERIQKEAADPESPHHLQAMLQLGVYKVYTTEIYPALIDGFEKICEVALLGKEHTANAYDVMDFTDLPENSSVLQLIFTHYNNLPQKTDRTQTILAICYEKGIGTPQDINKAMKCYELAANHYAPAQYNLGSCMHENSGEQLAYFQSALEQGYAPAQNEMGVYYQLILKDEKAACELYILAAAQGYAPAQNNLALYYESINENAGTVIRLYKSAAAQGYEEAQHNLDCYLAKDNASVYPLLTPQRRIYQPRKGPVVVFGAPIEQKKKSEHGCVIL